MPSIYDLVFLAIIIGAPAAYGYAAFSAFSIRRRLSGDLYRKQALGIGIVSILFGVLDLTTSNVISGLLFSFLAIIVFWGVFVSTFYWIDTSVRAARLSDPLLRDSLHWSRLRFVLWGYLVAALPLVGVIVIEFPQGGPPPAGTSPLVDLLFVFSLFAPIWVTLVSGFVVFPVVARRSGDRNLRHHLAWFGAYAAVIFASAVGSFLISSEATQAYDFAQGLVAIFASYFLYRSSRSLAPIYRFDVRIESAR
jgi:hypothetical protein